MGKDKNSHDFKNFLDFRERFQNQAELPRIVGFVSNDSYEFELLAEFYRDYLRHKEEPFEGIVFTAEGNEVELFFSCLFTLDMFVPTKLVIVRSATAFFKPFLVGNTANELYQNFLHHLPQKPDSIYLLFHYDHWEISSRLKNMFGSEISLIVSRNFYPNETKANLEKILQKEEISMTPEAIDEFLHRTPSNLGSYIRNVRKLRAYTGKKNIDLSDIEDVLFPRNHPKYIEIASIFFQLRRYEFFREIDKISNLRDELGILLSKLLERLNELRIFRIYQKKFPGAIPEEELFRALKIESYTSGRKYHIRKELATESRYLKDKSIEILYDTLIQLNVKHKFCSDEKQLRLFAKRQFLNLFSIMER